MTSQSCGFNPEKRSREIQHSAEEGLEDIVLGHDILDSVREIAEQVTN